MQKKNEAFGKRKIKTAVIENISPQNVRKYFEMVLKTTGDNNLMY